MASGSVLVNDTVRIKVKFVDVNPANGAQIAVSPVLVQVTITKSNQTNLITNVSATSINASEYYYDFTPTIADTYKITFVGILSGGTSITVNQQLYVSTSADEYKPKVTLKSDETVSFASEFDPLYINPEQIQSYFPEASLLEIGELIHYHSLEVYNVYGFNESSPTSSVNYISLEYIEAAACCDLSRTFSYGAGDDISVQLGDLSVTARNSARNTINRANAVTWCQIAAALRKEMVAGKTGSKGMQPRGFPNDAPGLPGNYLDPDTGRTTYLTDRDMQGISAPRSLRDMPLPRRGLRNYD